MCIFTLAVAMAMLFNSFNKARFSPTAVASVFMSIVKNNSITCLTKEKPDEKSISKQAIYIEI